MRYIVQALLASVIMATPMTVQAQQYCGDRDAITKKLNTGYGETFSGGGLRNETSVLEVWTSEDKGTWTILMTNANGTTCVMASGTAWRNPLPSDKLAGIPG